MYCVYVKHESSIIYHSKAMANVKVFADKQTNEQNLMYRAKTLCSRSIDAGGITAIYRCRGIKNFIFQLCKYPCNITNNIFFGYSTDIFRTKNDIPQILLEHECILCS